MIFLRLIAVILFAANCIVWYSIYQAMQPPIPEIRVIQDSSIWRVNPAWI